MTKNIDYAISIPETLEILRRKWKFVCLIALAFAVLCGGYKYATSSGGTQAVQSYENYEKDVKVYESLSESAEKQSGFLMDEWQSVSRDRMNNPIFTVDPYNCEYEQIVIRFEGDNSNHDWTVSNWIIKADNKELFGDKEGQLADYKSSLIYVAQKTDIADTSETAVQVLAVEDFDTKKAADYLVKIFNQYASDDGILVAKISSATAKGYNENVVKYQQSCRDVYNSIAYAFSNSKQMGANLIAPTDPNEVRNSMTKAVIKFCVMGFILGFILAAVYIVLDVIRKREIISARQVGDAFDLELLGDCSSDDEAAIEVLNANLDIMAGEHTNIAIIADESIKDLGDVVSSWTQKSDRTFMLCDNIFDNPEMIESLRTADGIVIGIRIGQSKLEQIQRKVLRAKKLKREILGYVII